MIERSKAVVRYQPDNDDDKTEVPEDGLGLDQYVSMFEEAEESSDTERKASEEVQDFYDNIQLSEEELAELKARKQPPVQTNRIKRKIDYLLGLEKQQRTKPHALPRTPQHQNDADSCTDALRYVVEDQNYKMVRSMVWNNMLLLGQGAAEVKVKEYKDEICIKINRFRWDRFFRDPHSVEHDFSDAKYLGGIWWMDVDDAEERWPGKEEVFERTLTTGTYSSTYEDVPDAKVWGNRKRRRVRICQIWYVKAEVWYYCEFTKGGILKEGKSIYLTDDGKSDRGIFAQSAYVKRDGTRYGLGEEMVWVQKEINKRRSKSLHLLNTNQILTEEGAVQDIEKFRKEAGRPDGVMIVNEGYADKTKVQNRTDLAAGHLGLLQEAKEEIDLMGPNASMQGEGGKDASGRAIIASQQGGMTEMADLMDKLRNFDHQIYRAVWHRIRQFWTEEKWIRVTDDDRNIKFVGLNRPAFDEVPIPQHMQIMNPNLAGQTFQIPRIDPQTGQQAIENNVAELEVDIIIDDVPDSVTPQGEQFENLVKLKQFDPMNEIPLKLIIQAMPNMRDKDKLLEFMEEREAQAAQQPPPPDPMQIEVEKKKLEVESKAQMEQTTLQGKQAMQKLEQEHFVEMARLKERIMVREAQIEAAAEAQKARERETQTAKQMEFDLQLADLDHREGAKRRDEEHAQGLAQREREGALTIGQKSVDHGMASRFKDEDHDQAKEHREGDHEQSSEFSEADHKQAAKARQAESKGGGNGEMKAVLKALSELSRGLKEVKQAVAKGARHG